MTNEYGSLSGEFTLPKNTLAGRFTISTEEPDDSSDFWDYIDDYNEYETGFRVEEYKRPTFEVTFDEIKKAYTPNDSITVTGNAKAFLGSNVTDADGEYTISRAAFSRYYSYYRGGGDSGRQIDAGTLTTDDKGNFTITFKADFEEQPLTRIFQFKVDLKITDLNGETREGSTAIKVGLKNLYTVITSPERVSGGDDILIDVQNKNLNDVLVSCDNTLKIFKVEAPQRVLFERLWETPQYQTISEDAFTKAFPQEPYMIDTIPRKRGKMVYEGIFKNQATYDVKIPTSTSWEAGEYEIAHIAQGENDTNTTTIQSFTITQPKNTYLPADQLFSYEQINENPKEDGFIKLRLKTSLKNLPVFVYGYYKQERFYAEKVDVNGNETVKITLDPSFEEGATIRLKYAQYDRFFSQEVPVDLSAPSSFLQVETETFRSKLYPDSKEKWSFKITDQDGKKSQAEALASMYDSSLDKFVTSYWNTDIAFNKYNYSGIPSLNNYDTYINDFQVRLREGSVRRYSAAFDKLNFFGLSFTRSDYANNRYLNGLRNKQKLENDSTPSNGNITGIILDSEGNPLPGANVLVKGTSIGTTTDFDGQFSIDAKATDILEIAYVGFESREIPANQKVIYVTLESDNALEEVVVTAQGIKKEKRALGYAVSSVMSEDTGQLLQGKASGISIRGYSSISGLNNPLYVINGEVLPEGGKLPNPSEFINIEVLKGLSATKEYGEAGKNGVVLITIGKEQNFDNVKVRSDLKETAFFYPHLETNKKGEIKFTFDAPQLLTRWKFRLLAHSKDVKIGGLEKEVITQKDLSIVPNTPRFLREGDTVQLSAKIANLIGKEMQGSAQLQLYNAVTMQPIDAELANTMAIKNFAVDAYGNTSVFWELKIPLGMEAVTYRMLAKSGTFSDGEENILPVLANRMMITETVPFIIRAGAEKTVQMNHLLNNTSTTLDHKQFVLEYTANPSWYALQGLPYLMEFPHECAEQTFSRLYANSLSAKILNSNPKIQQVFNKWKGDGVLQSALEKNEDLKNILIAETPWVREAQSETERKKRLGLLFDLEKNAAAQTKALDKLKEMQNEDGGFPWFAGGTSNEYITRHIVAGLGHLEKLGIEFQENELLERAIDYLDISLENEFTKHLADGGTEKDFYKRRSNLHFLYARSFFAKAYPIPFTVKNSTDRSLEIYNREWLEASVYEKGMLALVNYRSNNAQMATTILTGLRESAVQSDVNGMYWKENSAGWYWYQAPIETHSLLIEAFDEVTDDQKTVEELKVWLIQQKRTSDWKTTKATAAATYALLMTGTDFLELEDSVSFVMQTEAAQLNIENAPREEGTGYFKAIWKDEEVTREIAQVRINNTGTTAGYGGLYWQYFEDLDKIEQAEAQVLNLSKKLYLVNDTDASAPLTEITTETPLELGQTVRVQLIVTSQSNMEFIHLKDMRASGLEPVDVISKHNYQDGLFYYQSTRDVATHFFFDRLPQGTYVLEYDLRVNNKGSFSNGVSTVQSMYAPEFSGNTAGMRIKVD